MELSYGVPFGKKSKTVTRAGDIVEEDVLEPEVEHPNSSRTIHKECDAGCYQYHANVVGHASRIANTPIKESKTDNTDLGKNQKRKGYDLYFEGLCTPISCDDLPHPNKLRKHEQKKPAKFSRSLEKQMCVDNHLRQLQQRNYKYQLFKNEKVIPQSPNIVRETSVQPQELYQTENSDTSEVSATSREQTPFSSESSLSLSIPSPSIYLPLLNLPHLKTHSKPKQVMFPPGSVLLGSASLEQEEEEKWFRQLWKPRNKSRYTEE